MSLLTSNAVHTCIPCRFSSKGNTECPKCHKEMTYMGKAFKPPRKTNDSQWRKVALIVEHGGRFGYCTCHRPKGMPITLSDAKSMYGVRRK
jgi:hypothetical protein